MKIELLNGKLTLEPENQAEMAQIREIKDIADKFGTKVTVEAEGTGMRIDRFSAVFNLATD